MKVMSSKLHNFLHSVLNIYILCILQLVTHCNSVIFQTITAGSGSLFEMVAKRPAYMTPPRRTPVDKLLENYSGNYIYYFCLALSRGVMKTVLFGAVTRFNVYRVTRKVTEATKVNSLKLFSWQNWCALSRVRCVKMARIWWLQLVK